MHSTTVKRKLERVAARLILDHIEWHGWNVRMVDDGEPGYEPNPQVTTIEEALDKVFGVDEASVYVTRGKAVGRLYFVLGNAPEEVLSDYTINISALDDFDVEAVLDEKLNTILEGAS